MTVLEFRQAVEHIEQHRPVLTPEERHALKTAVKNVSMYRVVGQVDAEAVQKILAVVQAESQMP